MVKYVIDNRTEPYVAMHLRLTIKDYKEPFYSNSQVRLIRFSKSAIARLYY